MAYSKLIFCNSDYPLGYQTVNQQMDNFDASFDAMAAEHREADLLLDVNSPDLGRHVGKTVVRDVVQVYGTRFTSGLFGTTVEAQNSGNNVLSIVRASAGVYVATLAGIFNYWGSAAANSSTAKPLIVCRSVFPTTPNGDPSIIVTCYEMGSGSLVATDMEFTLTVNGEIQ